MVGDSLRFHLSTDPGLPRPALGSDLLLPRRRLCAGPITSISVVSIGLIFLG